jgi:hypothetical protein
MAWYLEGYPATFMTESLFENTMPYVHTADEWVLLSPS